MELNLKIKFLKGLAARGVQTATTIGPLTAACHVFAALAIMVASFSAAEVFAMWGKAYECL